MEVNILRQVEHENIIKIADVFDCDMTMKLFIVIELATKGELDPYRGYKEQEISELTRQLLEALSYLHDKERIAHRDLKPQNLLISGQKVLISDFGLASTLSSENILIGKCGTWGYLAPEMSLNQPYGSSVDLWSLGVIAYQM
jgi:serine/threonine protein kinase